ncbi:ROK family transcriptional regulator [uncultured Devosia sp.]|uniref:ROK family transcriptional regulator n=1 Tax=uncultured Devosia sp. TaxID=211434 RepID=UPI002634B3F9|nr:ROK family transcriptional regulator [uncultured Devosia sp.]
MPTRQELTRDVFEPGRRGMRPAVVRRANEKTVLTVVAFNAGASNAEISRISDLAPQTVSAILTDLEREGLIIRGPVLRGRRGQPATPIFLNENGGFAIGIEIGWRHMEMTLVNMHTKVLRHHHEDYAYPDARTLFDRLGALIAEFAASLREDRRSRLLDLGLAMPGSLTRDLDLLGAPPEQAALWQDLDPVEELRKRTNLEISLLNDGNAGCWAELLTLEPPRPANVIFLLVSQVLLAGMVSDGTLWEGPTGHAVDLGSMLVSVGQAPPQLVHRVASLCGLRTRLANAGYADAQRPVSEWDMAAIATHIDTWIGDAAQALAQIIHNTSMILERPVVILDTDLGSDVTARLAQRLSAELESLTTRGFRAPRVTMGRLGPLAPAMGAAEMTLYRRYF